MRKTISDAGSGARVLVGREQELENLRGAATDVAAGYGRMLVVEGVPGVGKTSLVDHATKVFAENGVAGYTAHAAQLEIDFPYGVVRQLFVRLAHEEAAGPLFEDAAALARPLLRDDAQDTANGGDTLFARLHGLYWFCATLAERGPFALFIDDAQWCDVASLRFIDFLGRRVAEHPIGIVIAAREGVNRGPDGEMERLIEHPNAELMPLGPLSPTETGKLVSTLLDKEADPAFVSACYTVTRGNPLLLRELIREIHTLGLSPDERGASTVTELSPAAITRLTQRRLGKLSPAARQVAEAVAVVGDDTALADVTTYAGLPGFEEDPNVRAAVDALVELQILDYDDQALRYSHPIVRSAVYGSLSPSKRSDGHRRAAELLRARDDPERLAAHLLACPPTGERWIAEALRSAAQRALSLGAPESARQYLKRALEEEVAELRVELLLDLGGVEQDLDRSSSELRLHEALAAAVRPEDFVRAASALGASLYHGRPEEAHRVLAEALGRLDATDDEHRFLLESQIRMNAHLNGLVSPQELGRVVALSDRETLLASTTASAALVLGCLAHTDAVAGEADANASAELARDAVRRRILASQRLADSFPYLAVLQALTYSDHLEEVASLLNAFLADAQRRGSVYDFATASWSRSGVNLRAGRLHEAEADAEAAIEGFEQGGWPLLLPRAVGALAETRVEAGNLDGARAAFQAVERWEQHTGRSVQHLYYARGLLSLAEGHPDRALDDLLACGRLSPVWEQDFPARLAWRSAAAMAAERFGDHAQAVELATAELDAARRFGAPRALGIALRVAGTLDPGDAGTALLEEACAVLEDSEAKLEYAKALQAYGTRIAPKKAKEAREVLATALDLADRCGATALAAETKDALIDSGARPRRMAVRGADALTASERRIAELASEGHSNKAIAQSLFITIKTVEMHLGNAYKKLGIRSRQQLAAVLEGERTATAS